MEINFLVPDNSNILIRLANLNDITSITTFYKETVRNINAKDYTPEQIEVWANGALNTSRWQKAIAEQYFIVAEIQNNTPFPQGSIPNPDKAVQQKAQEGDFQIAGFSSIAKDGYLDFMYVHKDHQRAGVASALLNEIEKKAKEQNNSEIYSHVSKTAKGFFEKMGYEYKEDLRDIYKGVLFINALMVKKI